jgi:hypothetical protein
MNGGNAHVHRSGGFLALLVLSLLTLLPLSSAALPPDVKIKGFSVIQEGETGRWVILATEAFYDVETVAVLEDVKAQLVKDQIALVDVKGKRGRYISDRKTLSLEGGVTVRTGYGYIFRAPAIVWSGEDSTITSKGGVEIQSRGLNIKARSLRYSIPAQQTTVNGDIRSVWRLDERNR